MIGSSAKSLEWFSSKAWKFAKLKREEIIVREISRNL